MWPSPNRPRGVMPGRSRWGQVTRLRDQRMPSEPSRLSGELGFEFLGGFGIRALSAVSSRFTPDSAFPCRQMNAPYDVFGRIAFP